MGIKCAVFGHVYDGTEFEEHHTERPRGEVLICREYQVCRRCGNRTEMYRNERLLTPRPESDGSQADGSVEVSDPTTDVPSDSPENDQEGLKDEGGAPLDDETEPGEDASAEASWIEDSPETRVPDVSTEGPGSDDRDSVTTARADTVRGSVDDPPADTSRTDDAVVLTDGASAPGSAAAADDSDIGCPACGQMWDRSTTSLRDGDICPTCGRGYVER